MELLTKDLQAALNNPERSSGLENCISELERAGGTGGKLDLEGGALSDDAAEKLADAIRKSRIAIDTLDLRRNSLSTQALTTVCLALEHVSAEKRNSLGLAPYDYGEPAPCWLELGANEHCPAGELVGMLRDAGVRVCIPLLGCSRRRCKHMSSIHLSMRVYQSSGPDSPPPAALNGDAAQKIASSVPSLPVSQQNQTPMPHVVSSGAVRDSDVGRPESLGPPPAIAPPSPPIPEESEEDSTLAAPVVASAAESPIVIASPPAGFRNFQRVFGVRGCPGGEDEAGRRILALEAFEELEVLNAAPLVILGTGCAHVRCTKLSKDAGWLSTQELVGDPCDRRAFELLKELQDGDGLSAFVDRIVERLGGCVVDTTLRREYVDRLFGVAEASEGAHKATMSFQGLLTDLHDRKKRNDGGIRMPGDYYGIREYYQT